jgi:hypothetical protein
MSNIREIRVAIETVMAMVPDIGNVYIYERYAKRSSDFKAFYEYQGQIRGWYIRRLRKSSFSSTLGLYDEVYHWTIRGFMSVSDNNESELVFDDLIEAIQILFRAHDTLNGTVRTCITAQDEAGIQVVKNGHVMLSGVLCHEAQLSLKTMVTVRG